MRTVLTSKIDGFDIIDGFGEGGFDPEATKEALKLVLPTTPELLALVAKKNEIVGVRGLVKATKVAANQMSIQIKALKEQGMNAEVVALENQQKVEYEKYKTHMAVIDQKTSELAPLHQALETKTEELRVSEAVYFQPKQGEFLESDLTVPIAELEAMYPIPAGKLPALDGTLIDDLRGVTYWEKDVEWVSIKILKIDVAIPVGGINQVDLTSIQIEEIETQLEAARVVLLTVAEKLAEKTLALEKAAIESERLFNQYTIQATTDPLGEAQAWLAGETTRLEAKYV